MKKDKTFRLATLGCRTNQYESQAYRDQLLAIGYREAKEGEEAEICIVNTCTVTESADSSSRSQIRKLVRQNPEAKVVVTGCLAERRPDLIQQIGKIDHIVPNLKKETLVSHIVEEEVPEFSIKNFEAHTRAFVKVQDGCNSFCTNYPKEIIRDIASPFISQLHRAIYLGLNRIVDILMGKKSEISHTCSFNLPDLKGNHTPLSLAYERKNKILFASLVEKSSILDLEKAYSEC